MSRGPEPCDICRKGLDRPKGAVGVLRCRSCHDIQLRLVVSDCRKRGWRATRMVKSGREVVKVTSPLGPVHLVDMDDLGFLLADVEGALHAA